VAEEKVQWLARGKEHRAQRMLADAVWCFEMAVKEPASSQEAYFLLGSVWWELGDVNKAYAVWRQGYAKHPAALPCLQAMSEVRLFFGDVTGAAEHAAAVLKVQANEPRAETLNAIAAAMRGDAAQWEKLEQWAGERQAIFCDPAFARALASALNMSDAVEDATTENAMTRAKQRFSEKCLAMEASWPPVLRMAMLSKVLLLPYQRAVYVDKAQALFDEGVLEQDSDGIRSLALVLRQVGCIDAAKAFFQWYGEIQEAIYARRKQQTEVLPLQWQRRTAGEKLRVSWLLPTWSESSDDVKKRLSTLLSLPDELDVWVLGDAAPWQTFLDAEAKAVAATGTKTVRSLPASPAMLLNLFDYDMLIDFAGMSWSMETFFIERPARQVWAFVEEQKGLEGLSWWNRVFKTAQDVKDALTLMRRNLPPSAMLSAREFIEKKDEALKAHQQGDWATARATDEILLNDQPEMALLHYLSGMLARDSGNKEEAVEHLSHTVVALPGYAKPIQTMADFLLEENPEQAQALVEKGLSLMPTAPGLRHMAGKIAVRRGESAKAEAIFRDLLLAMPTNGEVHFDLGNVLQRSGQQREAMRSYQRALLFEPDLLNAHFNLGQLLREQGQLDAASRAYRYVLSKQPKHVSAYTLLGNILAASGKLREWFENFRQFQTHCPQSIAMASQGLDACQFMGDFKGVDFFLDGLRRGIFKAENDAELIDVMGLLLFQLLSFDIEPELSLRLAKSYDAAMQRVFGATLPRAQKRRPGKIRVGYLSADLWDHVMGRMVWQAVQHHDKEKFELFFYSLNGRQDSVTEQFQQLADHFQFLPRAEDRELANQISADDLDILVDLSANTGGAEPEILALKPARVLITHVASAGTVGLSAIDFKLTDHDADLPEMQSYQIETFLPMQGCVYPYVRIEAAAEHPYHRDALGIAQDAVLIGAFVAPKKMSARCMALWRQVLEQIPKAKLVFSPLSPASAYVPAYQNVMRSAGIGDDRYLFLSPPPDKALRQARYAIIDFVLDTMPYGNVNGALEPLNAGVPIITLVGRRHGERSTYSILKNLGETRTIAQSGREYVEIAKRLSEDRAFMADVRAGIRRGLEHSPLVDMAQHCRHLEEAYLRALEMKAPEVLGSQA